MHNRLDEKLKSPLLAAVVNLLLAYVVMMLTRVIFFVENWATFAPYMSWSLAGSMLKGALVFDTSALLYVNALYLVLTLLPWHGKETLGFHRAMRWLYVVTNAIAAGSNLVDSVFFQYTGRRTTITVFNEFGAEGNITSIILTEALRHWYLVLAFIVLVWLLWRCFVMPRKGVRPPLWRYRWPSSASEAVPRLALAPSPSATPTSMSTALLRAPLCSTHHSASSVLSARRHLSRPTI